MVQSFQFTNDGLVKYYYEVEFIIHAFGLFESYEHVEEFNDLDLSQARSKAFKFYQDTCNGIEKNGYFLPIASYENFVEGKNSCYSICLSLVRECNNEKEYYTILGDEDEKDEALECEMEIYCSLNNETEL